MNFKILKEVIMTLKKKVKCPGCDKHIANREIFIEAVQDKSAVIRCECSRCESKTIIELSLVNSNEVAEQFNEVRQHQGLQVKAHAIKTISNNDVLDIKNFLKDFTGDFKNMFKE
jgi:transcription elongation factor Elf1